MALILIEKSEEENSVIKVKQSEAVLVLKKTSYCQIDKRSAITHSPVLC